LFAWCEAKFTRHVVSHPRDLHLVWVCRRVFLIIADSTAHWFTCHLLLIMYVSMRSVL
jgi:hypothetical protein